MRGGGEVDALKTYLTRPPEEGGRVVRRFWANFQFRGGRPTIWMIVGQGPIVLAVGAGGGLFGHFYSHLIFCLFFLTLFGRRPDID